MVGGSSNTNSKPTARNVRFDETNGKSSQQFVPVQPSTRTERDNNQAARSSSEVRRSEPPDTSYRNANLNRAREEKEARRKREYELYQQQQQQQEEPSEESYEEGMEEEEDELLPPPPKRRKVTVNPNVYSDGYYYYASPGTKIYPNGIPTPPPSLYNRVYTYGTDMLHFGITSILASLLLTTVRYIRKSSLDKRAEEDLRDQWIAGGNSNKMNDMFSGA
jgi:hypothetical protein